jgi:hypothetical protein
MPKPKLPGQQDPPVNCDVPVENDDLPSAEEVEDEEEE